MYVLKGVVTGREVSEVTRNMGGWLNPKGSGMHLFYGGSTTTEVIRRSKSAGLPPVKDFSSLDVSLTVERTKVEEVIYMIDSGKETLKSWGTAIINARLAEGESIDGLSESTMDESTQTMFKAILNMYDNESVLVPTLSNTIRDTRESRLDYFLGFAPRVTAIKWYWDDINWQVHDGIVTGSGAYDFTLTTGETSKAQFVITIDSATGKILTHMSRLLPEGL